MLGFIPCQRPTLKSTLLVFPYERLRSGILSTHTLDFLLWVLASSALKGSGTSAVSPPEPWESLLTLAGVRVLMEPESRWTGADAEASSSSRRT